jgi:hypothetical protein
MSVMLFRRGHHGHLNINQELTVGSAGFDRGSRLTLDGVYDMAEEWNS